MKTNLIAVAGIASLVLFAVALASAFEIRLASAQVDATSSPLSSSSDATTSLTEITSTSTTEAEASTTPTVVQAAEPPTENNATSSPTSANSAIEPPPTGLKEVHIIGNKYTDYFTDGTTEVSFPGDPIIDGHLSDPGAPIPTHEGLTWVHTVGRYLYDTPSGDLEVGDYALQPLGTYIQNAPPFVSSTSTPAEITASTTNDTDLDTSAPSTSVPSSAAEDAASSTITTPSDPATITSSDATTSPII